MPYLKIKDTFGYDDYYFKLNNSESNWTEVLNIIHGVIDNKYLELNEDRKIPSIVGIKMEFEIVESLPKDIEID